MKTWLISTGLIGLVALLSIVFVGTFNLGAGDWKEIFYAFYTLLGVSMIPVAVSIYQSMSERMKDILEGLSDLRKDEENKNG